MHTCIMTLGIYVCRSTHTNTPHSALFLTTIMIVLVKNLYTVHILIWLTQIRNHHHLWWRSTACLDTARRSTSRHYCRVLWRRAALRNHSLSMPECAFWAGPPPPQQTKNHPPLYIHIHKQIQDIVYIQNQVRLFVHIHIWKVWKIISSQTMYTPWHIENLSFRTTFVMLVIVSY